MKSKLIVILINLVITGYIYGFAQNGTPLPTKEVEQTQRQSDITTFLTPLSETLPADSQSVGRVDLSISNISISVLIISILVYFLVSGRKNILLLFRTYREYQKHFSQKERSK